MDMQAALIKWMRTETESATPADHGRRTAMDMRCMAGRQAAVPLMKKPHLCTDRAMVHAGAVIVIINSCG